MDPYLPQSNVQQELAITPFVGSGSSGGGPQPDEHETIDLSHLANLPENRWPENTEPNFGLKLSKDEMKILGRLKKRMLVPSRYICVETLRKLSILGVVKELASNIGIWRLIAEPMPAYRTLTYEFLATFQHDGFDEYNFQLDGSRFSVSSEAFNTILGLPPLEEGEVLDNGPLWNEGNQIAFEEQITSGARRDTARTSLLGHPVTRILQRAMAFTLFGRGETVSVLSRSDTYFLYKMLYAGSGEAVLPDVGAFLARRIDHIAASNYVGGSISIGGIVTRIARALNVIGPGPVYRVKVDASVPLINMKYLKDAHLLKLDGNTIQHVTSTKEYIRFPLHPFVISDPSTWIASSARSAPLSPPTGPEGHSPAGDTHSVPHSGNHQELMNFMHEMQANLSAQNTTLMQANVNLSGQISGLAAQYSGLAVQHENLQAAYLQSQSELHDLRSQMTQNDLATHTRFNDIYEYAERTEQMVHDTHQYTRRMYSWNQEMNEMPSQPLDQRHRPSLQYPYLFPSEDPADGDGGDAPFF